MNTNKAVLTIGAISTIVLLGVLSAVSPAFRPHATDIAVIALVFVCMTGIVAAILTIVWPADRSTSEPDQPPGAASAHRRWGGDTR